MKKITKKSNKIKEKWQKCSMQNHVIVALAFVLYAGVLSIFMTVHHINQVLDSVSSQNISLYHTDPEILQKAVIMLKDSPMSAMAPYVAEQDPEVAAFLIAIAKKESAWGKHAPRLNGKDCYNYWGFRQKRERMGSGGHTCFDSPREAVHVVAHRIKDLLDKKYDTPQKMIVWKCGFSCQGHSSASVEKWIQDVGYYKNIYDNL